MTAGGVIIVGSGAAGLACALALAPTPVTVLTKTAAAAGGSSLLAQGGIAAALDPADSAAAHAADTMAAADGLADGERVRLLAREGIGAVQGLIDAGLAVDRDDDGGVALGREGAHSHGRIVHAGGDAIGRNLIAALLARVAETPSIDLAAEVMAVDLVTAGGRVRGVLACRAADGWVTYPATAVILATGGAGALWRETTNPPEATGDGIALAARAGACLADLEFVQFHPTALLTDGGDGARLPLLTEALRGAGARLMDDRGRAIMAEVHPQGDLAPRDVVARALWRRRNAGGAVLLDLRPALATRGIDGFPQAVALCRAAGYDATRAPVPVTPAVHYHMGGVATDTNGRTSVPGLWAVGETAATGVHGANRLASNSLLEALVFARRVAADVTAAEPAAVVAADPPPTIAGDVSAARQALRDAMSRHVGIVRDGAGLARAGDVMRRLDDGLGRGPAPDAFAATRATVELRNMLLAGRLISDAAYARRESRGAHFRRDFPTSQGGWARRRLVTDGVADGVQTAGARA